MPPGTAIFGRLPPDREDRDILNKIEIIGHVTVIFGFYTVFGSDRVIRSGFRIGSDRSSGKCTMTFQGVAVAGFHVLLHQSAVDWSEDGLAGHLTRSSAHLGVGKSFHRWKEFKDSRLSKT